MRDPAIPDHDPMPLPPEAPDINDCCGNGCDPCIFDAHDLAMDAHRQALRAWQARQDARQDLSPTPTGAAPTQATDSPGSAA